MYVCIYIYTRACVCVCIHLYSIYIYIMHITFIQHQETQQPSQPHGHHITKRLTCFRQVFSANQLLWSVHCAQRRWEASVRCFAASCCLGPGLRGLTGKK